MKVLGIDPGYERLGIAVVDNNSGKEVLVFSECFKTDPQKSHDRRLSDINRKIEEVIEKEKPEILAIERLFFNVNQKTAMKVSEARGVVLACASRNNLKVFEYTPSSIKVAVTGHGKSDKKHIMDMIPLLVKITKKIEYDDEFDAIATALTCMASERF